jgi:hypothetical protein
MGLTPRITFENVYPFVAQYAVSKYRISEGWGLDLGSGPASLAIAMAVFASVTESIAALTRGMLSLIPLVSQVLVSTLAGVTLDLAGISRTSSKVSASSII